MNEVIMNIKELPELIYQRFNSDRVRVHEENGAIALTPINNTDESPDLWGLLPDDKFTTENLIEKKSDKELDTALERLRSKISDGRLSTENYVAQKQIDKELEG